MKDIILILDQHPILSMIFMVTIMVTVLAWITLPFTFQKIARELEEIKNILSKNK